MVVLDIEILVHIIEGDFLVSQRDRDIKSGEVDHWFYSSDEEWDEWLAWHKDALSPFGVATFIQDPNIDNFTKAAYMPAGLSIAIWGTSRMLETQAERALVPFAVRRVGFVLETVRYQAYGARVTALGLWKFRNVLGFLALGSFVSGQLVATMDPTKTSWLDAGADWIINRIWDFSGFDVGGRTS